MFLDLPHIISYVVIVFFLNLTPGVELLFISAQTIKGGKPHGFMACLGTTLGTFFYTVITAFGITEILRTSPFLFSLIKWGGVGYLFYLAYQAFASKALDFNAIGEQKVSADLWKTFHQSLVTSILNPKNVIFFFTFLPQFTNLGSPIPLYVQLLCLGAWIAFSGYIMMMLYVALLSKIRPYLFGNSAIQGRLQLIMGVIFTLLAINLLWEDLRGFLLA
jgi:threonine/homoserine/homoserine lactone efflux protein